MAITLDAVTLPNDLEWLDEFSWSYIQQSYKTTLGGTVVIEERELVNGKPITLAGGTRSGLITREVLDALMVKVDTLAEVMVLTLHNADVYNVMWRRDTQPIVATPLDVSPNPSIGTLYQVQLSLIEV